MSVPANPEASDDNAHSYAADPSPSGEAATAGETTGFVKVLGPSLRPSPPTPAPLEVERLARALESIDFGATGSLEPGWCLEIAGYIARAYAEQPTTEETP